MPNNRHSRGTGIPLSRRMFCIGCLYLQPVIGDLVGRHNHPLGEGICSGSGKKPLAAYATSR